MKLTCWIVDDEPLALELLDSYVQKTPFLKLTGKFSSAIQAMNNMSGERVDVIFLDIQMPEVSGMEFARFIDKDTRIIFTTAFSEYALDGYRVNALDYLLKPFSYTEFLSASKRALEWFEIKAASVEKGEAGVTGIFVRSDYKLVHVLFDEILLIEGLKDYVKIYTNKDQRPILTLMSMKSMEDELPQSRFIRVHRSFIVHRNKIDRVEKNRIIIGKHEIPIGETYRKSFMEEINGR
ncbi:MULTISPECIES: LytR/AlgR family response regulator transcription factor [Petrimonas]|jgi:two-component system LytT family response regulator|uniref:Putative response regulatory protein SO_2823 n=1 Tax=Petrimonas mucosa TaxID=1642646 RepID=A0A1G4G740_9BACT|nr:MULTISPECIES: LytTR family DNA-binding domain-containing protein [Petrimonas]MDD3561015.1 LytTR family DNA-binding domain-containing protein [Petrimonas mucosa]SCM57809.1 putative response regulatory protein SO_2823 [Petrimonas mucosa]SFU49122.1 two component transcriptional regulator, LytTR family [Porphyromonadaceae bacterium KHP3R9]HHT29605.1 response regulator transcription factor [Petrimonas mucosa]